MADVQRTRAQVLALFADNVTGQLSCQDLRDFVVTIMETEFANAGDFWAMPQAKYITTDKTAKGWKMYSQVFGSAVSFMNVVYQGISNGLWKRANLAVSVHTRGILGLAMDSYASDASGEVLRWGVVYDSSFSTVFSQKIGMPVYLDSNTGIGSISVGPTTLSVFAVGWVMASDGGSAESAIGKWFFAPDWGIKTYVRSGA
jgi:hypothetical protein